MSERERLHNQFILVHSTLSYIQSPEQPLGIPLVTNHKLQYPTPQRGDLDTTRTIHPLCLHTTLVKTPSDLTGLHTSQKKKLLQESERNKLHMDLQES